MALPTSRSTFKEYCLRALGKPVINIEVEDTQVDDRIDEALQYYRDYHFDGTEKVYYRHQVTADDIANKYITLPEEIVGAVRIFPLGFYSSSSNNMFNVQYQIALNDLYTLTSYDVVPYYMMRQHLNVLQEVLVGEKMIRFNQHTDKLHIDMDWDLVAEGTYIIVEAYQVVDPDVYTDVWKDRWLLRYATQLIKKQWGVNTSKYGEMVLPGGVKINGYQIMQDADAALMKMEDEMINSYSLPASDMIG